LKGREKEGKVGLVEKKGKGKKVVGLVKAQQATKVCPRFLGVWLGQGWKKKK